MDVTVSIEDDVARRVEMIAAERDTTLHAMVHAYLEQLAQEQDMDVKARSLAKLESAFAQFSVKATPRTWTRTGLYERS